METLDERPPPRQKQQENCPEHGWATRSRHVTSSGTVVYQRCVRCGAFRVDVVRPPSCVPVPVSAVLPRQPEVP